MMPGPYRCGCNASYGQSCPECDGTAAEDRELHRSGTSRWRETIRARERREQPCLTTT
jgi:hypothetical protein